MTTTAATDVDCSSLILDDEVDRILASEDGMIKRPKSAMCLHGSRSKCSHCLPLDPYDETYMAEKDIKHLSFHAYLRKTVDMDKKGKSSKESSVNYVTLCQWSTECSLQLLEDSNSTVVDSVCAELGVRKIGWIFTDLSADPTTGNVQCTRHGDSYFLTAEECITAGNFQNLHLNACKQAEEGHFGSKFVTVVATGDQHSSNIHFSGYQVSNQCAALVKDDWLLPVRNQPELAFVRDDRRCVPDVKYMVKDEYGNQVTKDGRPLPIEYLLVDVPAGMPKDTKYTFNDDLSNRDGFRIENRESLGELQNLETLRKYCNQFGSDEAETMVMFSDFHFLLFLRANHIHPIEQEKLKPLLNAVRCKNSAAVKEWRDASPDWATLTFLMNSAQGVAENQVAALGGNNIENGAGVMDQNEIQEIPIERGKWSCNHCTFENQQNSRDCEMCGLPRN